ncbi:DUF2339 domain-containing protein [Mycolicibacterium confluentis]|uniref:Uncharacterized protein n=1 Tax=Mycolicibacterium confluentis TaxID=28047 RepID=A0A7I7XWT4_9MYCO|nr:DUF2339 domain-containing protein [Mycolicibacterium confluentis]MCV7321982.1 DUF2339 domain-containing protein [Mycolicibacterium confluentis]ORV32223.1 hypothetical protein AWB99_11310 [Mycolicibacterium confluentis]BBZ33805.1 hypothetical protein MCNF_24100 [Mycolicibacterium confluentis]
MTAPHQDALQRLSVELDQLSQHMAAVSVQFRELGSAVPAQVAPAMAPPPVPVMAPLPPPPPMPQPLPPQPMVMPPYVPAPPRQKLSARLQRDEDQNWIGKLLAIAGVAVTLVGVVLLLVLAAQAGILRPEIRVAAGALLAAGLVGIGIRLQDRPGGQVGGVALTATGIAAAYMDVIAITTIYGWLPPALGLVTAAAIGGGGLTLARRWNSQQLALLVLVPLVVLAPIVADGVTLLLIGFMTALSAAALPAQLGRDWMWMHAARTAGVTLPLLVALFITSVSGDLDDAWLLGGACAVAALLAVVSTIVLLPTSTRSTAMGLLTVVGVLPALAAGVAVPRVPAVLMAAAVAAGMLALSVSGRRIAGVVAPVVVIWSALSAFAALIAVTEAFDGEVEAPALLGLALVVTLAGRRSRTAKWIGLAFAAVGGLAFLAYAPPVYLLEGTELAVSLSVSNLAASALAIACAGAIVYTWAGSADLAGDGVRVLSIGAGLVALYSVTMFTVTAGVLIGGVGGGFLAGHMAATICWIGAAAALLVAARRVTDPQRRTAPIIGGLALTAAATTKLFLFDLGTLDGMFRVAAFIVVGLVLLGMGTGYARSLAQRDEARTA